MAYDNRNSFVLFVNERKQGERDPDFTGAYTDDNNQEFYVSAWKRNTARGEMVSGKIGKAKQQYAKEATEVARNGGMGHVSNYAPPADEFSDDIPFN